MVLRDASASKNCPFPQLPDLHLCFSRKPSLGGQPGQYMPDGSTCDLICPDFSTKVTKRRKEACVNIFAGGLESDNPGLFKR